MSETTTQVKLFETEACSRCGGSGQYSYCQMYGSRCFKCAGSGKQYIRKHAKMAADYRNAVRLQKEPAARNIETGDFILNPLPEAVFICPETGKTKRPFVEVTGVEIEEGTPEKNCGYSQIGDRRRYIGWITLTFADGTIYRVSEDICLRRRSSIEGVLRYCEPKTAKYVKKVMEAARV